jgi:hypothetical protein
MKKLLAIVLFSATVPAVMLSGCGGSGCEDLEKKLMDCGAQVTQCNDDDAAGCTADKLNADCSNLLEAAQMCAG